MTNQSMFRIHPRACLIHPLGLCGLLFILLTSGCASSGRSTVDQPFETKLGQYKTASVEVTSAVPKPPANMSEFTVQLESRIIAKLRESKAWEKVYSNLATGDTKPEVNIAVMVTGMRNVDTFDRVMWGAMAGQAKTTAKVEVRDAAGKLLGGGNIEGKSSGGSVVAGTTGEAVERVADEVVKLVLENR